MTYFAHSPSDAHPDGQPLLEHLQNVSALAARFAAAFDAASEGAYAGMLHDIGKYSDVFQRRLCGAAVRTDHATAGATVAYDARIAPSAFAVAGHHGGLPDIGTRYDTDTTLLGRMSAAYRATLPGFSAYRQEAELPAPPPPPPFRTSPEAMYAYTKMLFSCLVDADWSDTGGETETTYAPLSDLAARLDAHFGGLLVRGELDVLRNAVRTAVTAQAEAPPGLFSLTVPTGGGKTLTSMAFALRHALAHGMERIIYVIPYCSILEQTGKVFKAVFGEENVRLHYSAAELKADEDADPNAFVSERWDAPIILTTAVQFFESLYSARPARVRKMHRVCRSVLIFDEAQMLPVSYLRPCVSGICTLTAHFGCTAVLCTATQPSLDRMIAEFSPAAAVRELCPPALVDTELLKRVVYRFEGDLSDATLAERISVEHQVLCIVNNRAEAQSLYAALPQEGSYCLTTWLTPHDRGAALETIRQRLSDGKVCRVVSTSLVEAGVDLDFPCVYRAIAGLDSIVQAGERCNREGRGAAADSVVHVFMPEASAPRRLAQNIAAAERTIAAHPDALASAAAVRDYFDFLLYTLKDAQALDRQDILDGVRKLAFRTVSDAFRLIDGEADASLYIPGDGGDVYLSRLRAGECSRTLFRAAAPFAVALPQHTIADLIARGKAETLCENGALLLDPDCYNPETGFALSEATKANFA